MSYLILLKVVLVYHSINYLLVVCTSRIYHLSCGQLKLANPSLSHDDLFSSGLKLCKLKS